MQSRTIQTWLRSQHFISFILIKRELLWNCLFGGAFKDIRASLNWALHEWVLLQMMFSTLSNWFRDCSTLKKDVVTFCLNISSPFTGYSGRRSLIRANDQQEWAVHVGVREKHSSYTVSLEEENNVVSLSMVKWYQGSWLHTPHTTRCNILFADSL